MRSSYRNEGFSYQRRNSFRDNVLPKLIGGIVVALFIALIVGYVIAYKATEETVEITVQKAERVTDRDGKSSRYLVYTDDETFENTDSMLYAKYNSSDLYGRIQAGKQYRVTVVGWRNPFFSMYRNIVYLEESR